MSDIEARVKKIIAEQLGVNEAPNEPVIAADEPWHLSAFSKLILILTS